jgi:chorismate mutase
MSDDPVQETEPVAAAEEQPRDAQGRFAPKAEPEPQPAPQAQAEPVKEEHVLPSWRAREIAEERRAAVERAERAEREAAQIRERLAALERQNQPKPEPVDIFADPNAWAQQQLSPLEQRMQSLTMNLTLRASRAENVAIHGRETVNAAEKAIEEAMRTGDPEIPGLKAKMLASDDPVGVAVDWHKSRSLLKETGGDLNAYRQRILDEAMKDPAFQAKVIEATRAQAGGGQAQPQTITRLPPSLNKIGSAANEAADNDMSDGALFAHAMR